MRLPPRWVRRVFLWPLPLILIWLYLLAVPLLLIVAFVLSYRLPGKLRVVRSLGLFTVYWKLRGERSQAHHYRLLAWALKVLVAAGRRLFVLDIESSGAVVRRDGSEPDDDVERVAGEPPDRDRAPLIVMSRHAGPADSILLLHELAVKHSRRPRIVLKEALLWDPAFDLILNRLPNRFIGHSSHGKSATELVGELAAGMGHDDVFVIFPEGGNFTERRRTRAIEHLEERGHTEAAVRARGLHNVLPPRPGGTLAALHACPDAAAVFVAHTGLDDIEGIADLWKAIPDHKVLEMVWRAVPAADVPTDDEGRTEMLWLAWEAIDGWIDSMNTE